ncbi:MAG: HAD-IA family hydrolase [Bacteroidota bacterium]
MAPRFVYFDLDDTLLDHRAAERAALADCCSAFPALAGRDVAEVQATYHAGNVPLWKQYGAGEIGREDVQRLRFERLCAALDLDLDPAVLGAAYLDRYAAHWRWIPGAEAAFHAIADRYPVGLLTNGFAEQQHGKLDRFPVLRERAQAVVISEEVGVMKPHPAIFAHATDLAGVAQSEVLYVGDSLHSDVEGGRAAGWQVAWFRGAEGHDGVFAFAEWTALTRALGAAS